MATDSIEKRFAILCDIVRAQHFAWREAVGECCPGVDPRQVVLKMWEITARETAKAYLKRVDRSLPLAPQIARSIVWSSECMGEDAVVEIPGHGAAPRAMPASPTQDEAYVRHRECPWCQWHERKQLLEEDRPGCDLWFKTTIDHVNDALGTKLRFETLETLPEGGSCCLRRLWVEE